jgi:prepilin-type N-terminal cleavage/methylation domain-containing protein
VDKRLAFTLAEVLITLSVIGVVAALTMPALMANWREKAYETAQTVFISKLGEATRRMNVDEKLTGYSSTEAFVTELEKYMKIARVCTTNPSECFAVKITNGEGTETLETNQLKTASAFGRQDYNTNVVGIVLANGDTAMLAYNPDCPAMDVGAMPSETLSCLSMVYDINSKAKPNQMTKDLYTLNANPFNTCGGIKVGSLCVSASDESYSPIDTCDGSAYISYDSRGSSNSYCNDNYWAGAKKACAEQGMRLPTRAELKTMKDNPEISGWFWSSEPSDTNFAYYVELPYGNAVDYDVANGSAVRCVK